MIVHSTSYFVHISGLFFHFRGGGGGGGGDEIDIFPTKMLRGGLVCVICNSKSFHSFLFKLCIMIVHILNKCTSYFVHILRPFFIFEEC